jgi:hypothetical protein
MLGFGISFAGWPEFLILADQKSPRELTGSFNAIFDQKFWSAFQTRKSPKLKGSSEKSPKLKGSSEKSR